MPASERRVEKPIVELLVTPDKTTAYVGEEIVLHVELITSSDVQGLEWLEPPKFPGAWAEDLERPERPTGGATWSETGSSCRFNAPEEASSRASRRER